MYVCTWRYVSHETTCVRIQTAVYALIYFAGQHEKAPYNTSMHELLHMAHECSEFSPNLYHKLELQEHIHLVCIIVQLGYILLMTFTYM